MDHPGSLSSCVNDGATSLVQVSTSEVIRIVVIALSLLFLSAQMVSAPNPVSTASQGKNHGREHLVRKAFVMTVNAGQEKEYARRHQPIWPELEATLKAHGVRTYTIFLLPETRQLVAYVEFDSLEQWNAVAKTDVCRKWWAYMKDIMPSNPDNSPVSIELHEVFHMDTSAHMRNHRPGAARHNATIH